MGKDVWGSVCTACCATLRSHRRGRRAAAAVSAALSCPSPGMLGWGGGSGVDG